MLKSKSNFSHAFINSSFLLVIHIINQFLPLLMIPYIARVLGIYNYGIFAFAIGLTNLCCVLTDYGFNLSITPRIAKSANRKKHINNILGAVFSIKLMLFFIASLFIVIYAFETIQYKDYKVVFFLLIIAIFGQTFQALWFFQGIEKMTLYGFWLLISKLFYILLVLLTVRSIHDLPWLVFSYGVSQVSAMLVGLYLINRIGFWPSVVSVRSCIKVFKQSTDFFWSRASFSTYGICGTVFLGMFGSANQTAYYSAAEQIYKALQSIMTPIGQVLYPLMARTRDFGTLFLFMKITTLLYFLGAITLSIISSWLVSAFYGPDFIGAQHSLLVFCVILTIYPISVLMGYPLLGSMGFVRLANKSVIFAGLLQVAILSVFYFTKNTEAVDVAWSVLIVEMLVFALRLYWSFKYYRGLRVNK